ncbi:class I SAM-dependent methyltransferase [Suttonella sp. R2A3]|uniref:class I SAM-dependent methyltransferase n=1 Tax=Suttonella sp. R2A3 TaxID=2908648 RepID=UPI001F375D6C|nr:class I SAM-dependent methyltransferase [Suttonella sp. R2A3]UJF24005.1 class I SAM-dependent methyltransferase [Suttonella sp. R2A3]
MTDCWFVGQAPSQAKNSVDSVDDVPQDHYLRLYADGAYALYDKQQRYPPLSIDFADAYYRFRGGKEYLPKAFKGLTGATIADTTAGWGRDAWLLAYRGFNVTMIERNPYLAFLLQQALDQAQANAALSEVASRLSLVHDDGRVALPSEVDAVYLDPMFPERRKQAKVKKHMQALHVLLGGEESDGGALLEAARKVAMQRVVVKRPQGAPFVGDMAPHHSLNAPNTRYDIYLPGHT